MAKKIVVAGYSQKVNYGNGIEYRNFSDDLVGNQLTTGVENSVFTMGNFSIITNNELRNIRNYSTNLLSDYIGVNDLNLDPDSRRLNLDITNVDNYALFGSLSELVRVSLENIFNLWPASLYVNPNSLTNASVNAPTIIDFQENITPNVSKFTISINRIRNPFDINLTENQISNTRNILVDYTDYVFDSPYGIFDILNVVRVDNTLEITIKGGFELDNSFVSYHIRPKDSKIEEFHQNIGDFEAILVNRNTTPKYKSVFKTIVDTDYGNKVITNTDFIFPVLDGYNLDFFTDNYEQFIENLHIMSLNNDDSKSDLVSRFLVANSITEFDTINYSTDTDYESSGEKVKKVLRIYGREYDEINKYIKNISNAHTVTYDKKDNVQDYLVKNLANTMGWDVIPSIFNNVAINEKYENEIWRRLVMNTAWAWKSKGTRKVIEFLIKFIGTPNGLINLNEFIYKADFSIDKNQLAQILEVYDEVVPNVDEDGFPINNSDVYFQKGGQWYRQTGGNNANNYYLRGNNPHIGPCDNGQEFINTFNELTPNFQPITITTEVVVEENDNLYINNNEGTTDGSGNNLDNINLFNLDNLESKCGNLIKEIVVNPKPTEIDDNCGCPVTTSNDNSIKLSIVRSVKETECKFAGFLLEDGGTVLFDYGGGLTSQQVEPECCKKLGFTAVVIDDRKVCLYRVDDPTTECSFYTLLGDGKTFDGTHLVFIDGDGNYTDIVPSSECCKAEGLSFVATEGGFKCYKYEEPQQTSPCDAYTFVNYNNNGQAVFMGPNNTTTITVPTAECCNPTDLPRPITGGFVCNKIVQNCPTYESFLISARYGLYTFFNADGSSYTNMPSPECCPINSTAQQFILSGEPVLVNGQPIYRCFGERSEPGLGDPLETPILVNFFASKNPLTAGVSQRCSNTSSPNNSVWIDCSLSECGTNAGYSAWSTATVLYKNAAGTIKADPGWYTPNFIQLNEPVLSRRWDGNFFTQNQVCNFDGGGLG